MTEDNAMDPTDLPIGRDRTILTEAAPDLYDALADLVGQCERDDPVIVIGRALAALRKARGDA